MKGGLSLKTPTATTSAFVTLASIAAMAVGAGLALSNNVPVSVSITTALASIGVAAFAAAWNWSLRIKSNIVSIMGEPDLTRAVHNTMAESCGWLQPLRPRFSYLVSSDAANAHTVYRRIASGFMSSVVIGAAVLAISMLCLILSNETLSQRGIFGALLQVSVGRALAVAFCVYAGIVFGSQIVMGLMFTKTQRGRE